MCTFTLFFIPSFIPAFRSYQNSLLHSLPLRIHKPGKIRFWDSSLIPDDEPAKKHIGTDLELPFDLNEIPIEIYFVRFSFFNWPLLATSENFRILAEQSYASCQTSNVKSRR